MKSENNYKAQSAIEFVANYSWLILIITVIVILLYMFLSVPSAIVPSECSFENGVYCNDLILASNTSTHVTKLLLLMTDTQPYPITHPAIYAQVNGANTSIASCEPSFANSGSQLFCVVALPLNLSLNSFLTGSIYLNAGYCSMPGSYPSMGSCSAYQKETYVGEFSAHVQSYGTNKPFATITLYVPNTTLTTGSNETVYATVNFAGIPVRNAIINFSVNATAGKVMPGSASTNETGVAQALFYGYSPASVSLTATYGNISANSILGIEPLPPPAAIFCVAGNNNFEYTNASYYAAATSNGLGAWHATASYPSKAFTESCSEYNGYVYCADGMNYSGLSNSTFFAKLSPGGLSAWQKSTPYPVKTYYQSCAAYHGKMYCVGGITNPLLGSATNLAYYSSISSSGFSAWQQASSYLISIYGQSCVAGDSRVYCVSGVFGSGNVYYANITSAGLGAWHATTSYPAATFNQNCVASNSSIYCIGGSIDSTSVYYAPFTSNGLGQWNATASYPIPIYDASCAVYGGAVYCIGGFTSTGPTSSVYYADITSKGLSAWHATASYPQPVFGQSCFA
ncbi:MAG: hypothetical protein ACP5UH_03080 [Candidatus Micrarchaeia archaeon]